MLFWLWGTFSLFLLSFLAGRFLSRCWQQEAKSSSFIPLPSLNKQESPPSQTFCTTSKYQPYNQHLQIANKHVNLVPFGKQISILHICHLKLLFQVVNNSIIVQMYFGGCGFFYRTVVVIFYFELVVLVCVTKNFFVLVCVTKHTGGDDVWQPPRNPTGETSSISSDLLPSSSQESAMWYCFSAF